MQVVHANEPPPERVVKSIFLEGPTPRDAETPSWRPDALKILAELGFDGTVYVPETDRWREEYEDQIPWEQITRLRADRIVCWVPRAFPRMPAFTTNVEFGEDYKSGRFIYGRPEGAPKTHYLDVLHAQQTGRDPDSTLRQTLERAVAELGAGALREGGDAAVPLPLWLFPSFQAWLNRQKAAGNRLVDAKILHVHKGPGASLPFAFLAHVAVHVGAENRVKSNEIVYARPDAAAVAALHGDFQGPAENLDAVLVREFRSTARAEDGFVLECPSGATTHGASAAGAAQELFEETGLTIDDLSRLRLVGDRQTAATVSIHSVVCFALALSEAEFAAAQKAADTGAVFSTGASERTRVVVLKLCDLDRSGADWATVGMLHAAAARLRSGS